MFHYGSAHLCGRLVQILNANLSFHSPSELGCVRSCTLGLQTAIAPLLQYSPVHPADRVQISVCSRTTNGYTPSFQRHEGIESLEIHSGNNRADATLPEGVSGDLHVKMSLGLLHSHIPTQQRRFHSRISEHGIRASTPVTYDRTRMIRPRVDAARSGRCHTSCPQPTS